MAKKARKWLESYEKRLAQYRDTPPKQHRGRTPSTYNAVAHLCRLLKQVEGLRDIAMKEALFDDLFMERFHSYARHKPGCTWDVLTKGDICTCGLQALINIYYEIKDAKQAIEAGGE